VGLCGLELQETVIVGQGAVDVFQFVQQRLQGEYLIR
jgi:hypothetical protein